MNDAQIALAESLLKSMKAANGLHSLHPNRDTIVLVLSYLIDSTREQNRVRVRTEPDGTTVTASFTKK